MRKTVAAVVMAVGICFVISGAVQAQSSEDMGRPEMRVPRGGHGDEAVLTEAQKETIQSILSQYDASSLTADDAKAIHRAFRDAGVRPCRGFREAILAAGFDPDKLRELDPPPERSGAGEGGPSDRGPRGKGPGQGMSQDRQ